MEEEQDLPEQPVKKAKMQESGEQTLNPVSNPDTSDQKPETSSLASNLTMSEEIMTCTDYIPRSSNDYTSQMYSAKPYAHILSVPVSETAYPGQTQYQTLQQSQPYAVYPQATQTYGLPPFASSTNASLIPTSSTIANIPAAAVASISNQDYPTYTILGQNQYQTCYPSSSFGVTGQTNSDAESTTLAATTYQTEKPSVMVPTPAAQRLSSVDPSTSPSLSQTTPSKDADDQSKKNMAGKNRGKRKADASSSQDSELERVFLWDLDETIIIFHSLLTGSYAQKYGKDPTVVIGSGLTMEEMIFEVADTHLFFNDLEECDQVHVEDVASDDNGQDLSNYSFSTDGFSGSGGSGSHGSSVGVQGGVDWMRKLAFRYRKARAKMRRAELQRARALQSYYEARARREKKIKSKKYHKIVRKGKAKKALKEFEQLRKVNPIAALEELEKMEKARMMERMSLKHQNSGKWAKSKAIMAKYDLEARQAMQEQLAKNKELTQKLQAASMSEEEEGGAEEEEELVPDAVNEVQMSADGPNPWMLRACASDAREPGTQQDPEQQQPQPGAPESAESEEDERPVPEEETLLKEFEERRSLRKRAEPASGQEARDSSTQEVLSELRALSQKLNKENHQSRKHKVSSAKTVLQAEREKPAPASAAEEEEPLLLQTPRRVQTLEELEELGEEGCFQKELPGPALDGQVSERNPDNEPDAPKGKKKKEQMIDLQNLLTTESPSVKSLTVPTTIEELEDEEGKDQKQIIKEAFAGDDVIRDFLREKREAVEASKPKDMDLTLPGWGEWGGVGLEPSAKKRRRFLIKAPEGPPRKDKNLPNVIINEKRNIHAAAHQVHVLPYPFTHHQQFERTIQTPIGSTWNTQRAFQKLTTPKVVTKPGHIIKPIKAEDVGYRSSPRSDLSVIQSNPKRLSTLHKKQLQTSTAD